MADEKELREVSLRLERLEAKLDTIGREPSVSALTEQDIAAYHKVQNAFWEDGSCGINETSPCVFRCNIFKGGTVVPLPRPKFCDIECTCGPCNLGGGAFGGAVRFRGLGG
jgi:hypothetical protein